MRISAIKMTLSCDGVRDCGEGGVSSLCCVGASEDDPTPCGDRRRWLGHSSALGQGCGCANLDVLDCTTSLP